MARMTWRELIDDTPESIFYEQGYNATGFPVAPVNHVKYRKLLLASATRVIGDSTSALIPSDGSSASSITVYTINLAAGSVLLGGVFTGIAALTSQVILGAGAWTGRSLTLAGGTPAALSADGKTYAVALILININNVATPYCIFSAEAADGAEVDPTVAQIEAALIAKDPATADLDCGIILARFKIKRVATDAITQTYAGVPASNATILAGRCTSSLFGVDS